MIKNKFGEPFQYIGREVFRNGSKVLCIDDLVQYYITENHSAKETVKHFNITLGNLTVFQNHYGIRKPKNLCQVHNKKTCLAKYGDPNYNNKDQGKKTCLEKYGVENPFQAEQFKEKAEQTKVDRYNNPHYVNPGKAKETCLEKYGVTSVNKLDLIKERKKESCLEHYGVEYPMQSDIVKAKYDFKQISEKVFETKKQNGTTNTSKIQANTVSVLKEIYGADDILTEYKEERYPYHCDIYIKSLDQFIELNLFFTHGGHPYDSTNEEDIKLLNTWKAKADTSKFFENAIRVWTELDPEKQLCAKNNKLNYLMFYSEQEILNYLKELKTNA